MGPGNRVAYIKFKNGKEFLSSWVRKFDEDWGIRTGDSDYLFYNVSGEFVQRDNSQWDVVELKYGYPADFPGVGNWDNIRSNEWMKI